jgi:hypothetical protein
LLISPCERRPEKLLPKRCILRKKRFTSSTPRSFYRARTIKTIATTIK